MKIVSFNANGIRARLPIITQWVEIESPDVLCIQETKVQDPDFPKAPFEELGYYVSFKGEKSYNGVAVLTKSKPDLVRIGLKEGGETEESRLIAAHVDGIPIVNTYVPQGQDPESEKFKYKINWLNSLLDYFKKHYGPDQPLVWTGDFNIAPESIDVYDPETLSGGIGFHPEEHKILSTLRDWGFVDVFRRHKTEAKLYTFWDYRIPNGVKRNLGWRIDHIWATACLAEKSTDAWIDRDARLLPRPSDHTFLIAEFDI